MNDNNEYYAKLCDEDKNIPVVQTSVNINDNIASKDILKNKESSSPQIGKKTLRVKKNPQTKTEVYGMTEIYQADDDYAKLIDSFRNLDIDSMIEYCGAEGKYQYMVLIQLSIMMFFISATLYSTGFLLADPAFKCQKGATTITCTQIEFCRQYSSNPKNWPMDLINWKYNSWVKHFELICDDRHTNTAWKQAIMFSSASFAIVSGIISDSYGRIFTMKLFSWSILLVSLIGYFFDDLIVKIVCYSISGGIQGIIAAQSTYVLNESCLSSSTFRSKAIAFFLACFAFGGMCMSLLTLLVDDADTLYLIIIVTSILSVISLPFTCFEPIKQLYNRGKISEVFRNLKRISEINGKKRSIEELQKYAQIHSEYVDFGVGRYDIIHKTTCKESLRIMFKNIRMLIFGGFIYRFFGFLLFAGAEYIGFNGVTYNSGDIGIDSVAINTILLCLIEVFANLLAMPLAKVLYRKTTGIICMILLSLSAVVLVVVRKMYGNEGAEKWFETLFVVVFLKGTLTLGFVIAYIYGGELFPSNLRGTATGLALNCGKFLSLTAPVIMEVCSDQLNVNPMAGCAAASIVALPFFFWMPETFGMTLE